MPETLSLPVLHHRFRNVKAYRKPGEYRLLPMRFTALDDGRVVLTNLAGEFLVTERGAIDTLATGRLDRESAFYSELVAKHFVLDPTSDAALDLLAIKYRTKHSHLAEFTGLHIFVVTLRCDHSCPYCQVSRVSQDKQAYDMTEETARAAVELVFRSPNHYLKIEFQGGESLLNFPMIRFVVELAESRNAQEGRDLRFVIATNLAPLTDEMLEYFREHKVLVSTSLDGPAELHNANRPRPEKNSHELAVQGIERCRVALGQDAVSALLTPTAKSLDQPEAIIDEYVARGFNSVFLRWLSPYGFAVRSERRIGYPLEAWCRFYEKGLRHILELNRRGIPMREEYAAVVLRKMLTPFPTGYVDLQSPSGLGLMVAVYNYDGDVYASDEARMLAEEGDKTFRLGNVCQNTYEELFLSERLRSLLLETMTEAVPQCADCAFEPYCGTDPCFHAATQGDPVGHRPTSAFCARNMFVFRLLIRLIEDESDARAILESWA